MVRNKTYNKPGPKGDYSDDMPIRAYKLALLGLNDIQMATALGIGHATIDKWKINHPEFREALNRGKTEADAKVAHSLFQRALGYSHPDTMFFKIYNKETKTSEIIAKEYVKHYPPDTTAMIFWLKNRQREHWMDVQHHEVNSKVAQADLSDLSDEKLKLLKQLGLNNPGKK